MSKAKKQDRRRVMTTAAGCPVGDNQNSLTAGARGPMLVDPQLMEKMAHFNRERVPERVVHAKGAGAYGIFTVTRALKRYTRAHLLAKVGNQCETFVRFSTVAGELGSADTVRDPRGFAVKFYTEEGNWDLVGNNTPVFFVRDPLKFSDFIQPETAARHRHARRDHAVGLLQFVAGVAAPSDLAVRRPRHSGHAAPHERLRFAHVQFVERAGRALLGEVALENHAGH